MLAHGFHDEEQGRALAKRIALGIEDKLATDIPSFNLEIDCESSNWLTVELTFCLTEERLREVRGTLPVQLTKPSNTQKVTRLNECLAFWIKPLIEVCSVVKSSYSIRLCACDGGDISALSMDGLNIAMIIPDLYSFQASESARLVSPQLYEKNPSLVDFKEAWQRRMPILFWRGATSGIMNDNLPIDTIEKLRKNHRVALCLALKGIANMNVKISKVVQVSNGFERSCADWLKSTDIFSEPVVEASFASYKYYPDIAGNVRAWGTIIKYLNGNLVFRPTTPRSLFYDRLMQPGVHYVPVNDSFSDLRDAVDWAERNTSEAALIAWRGQNVAREYLIRIQEHFKAVVLNNLTIV